MLPWFGVWDREVGGDIVFVSKDLKMRAATIEHETEVRINIVTY